ncbi:MAG: hypothetical protein IJN47_03705 [Clostridia bacterium]|nr:hypothetical protein [Clostridia bacterium]
MICPHCGAALANGLERCNCCGGTLKIRYPQNRMPREEAPQHQPPQPQYQPPVYRPPVPGTESKKVFFRQIAPKKLKIQWQLVYLTMALALILIAVGTVLPIFRPILRIPSVSGLLSVGGVSIRDVTDAVDMLYEELSQEYELGYWDGKELDMAEDLLDALDRFSGSFSLLDLSRLAGSLRNEYDGILRQYLGAPELRILDIVAKLPAIAIGCILASCVLPLTFTLLAGLKKSLGFTIAAMVLTLLPMVIINGWAFGTLTLAVFIPQVVFCANTRKGYKNYQLGYM